ncbi:type II toxin-antitoxin system Phd/YefM family antitoxin [candidate division KSB1 bacterium]|nr:type II toxin-antitoxin system Phd/YefM family antitoxin [candidate division KSB1 bacterium]
MIQVNTHEAKTKLSYLLAKVENEHEEIKICRNGKPIAILSPIPAKPNPLKQHTELMGVIFHEDPLQPLDDDEWPNDFR